LSAPNQSSSEVVTVIRPLIFFEEKNHMKKSLRLAALLILPGLIFAAKVYSVSLQSSAVIAGTELKSGTYSVRVAGENVIFSDRHSKEVSIPAKVANGPKKYEYTNVEYSNKEGKEIITAIHLAGSTITLEFEK
jgi:hypothetical protein